MDSVRGYVGKPITYYEAECSDIDPQAQKISCRYCKTFRGSTGQAVHERQFDIDYDILVVAVSTLHHQQDTALNE